MANTSSDPRARIEAALADAERAFDSLDYTGSHGGRCCDGREALEEIRAAVAEMESRADSLEGQIACRNQLRARIAELEAALRPFVVSTRELIQGRTHVDVTHAEYAEAARLLPGRGQ